MDRQGVQDSIWDAMDWADRAELLQRVLSDLDRPGAVAAVARALLESLLQEPGLQECYSNSSGESRARLERLLGDLARILCDRGSGRTSPFQEAYAKELLAQVLSFSTVERASYSPELLATLLSRAHAHESLAPLAWRKAASRVARASARKTGEELSARARELLVGQSRPQQQARWLPKPDRVYLSVDRTSLSCARYLAGLEAARPDDYGFDELPATHSGRAKRVDEVTVKFDSGSSVTSSPAGMSGPKPIPARSSELKGKLFVALLSLAAPSFEPESGRGVRMRLQLRDLMALLGFELGRKTSSRYYRRYQAEIVRYLFADLPNRVVAMQVSYPAAESLVVFERLLLSVLPLDRTSRQLAARGSGRLQQAVSKGPEEVATAVREVDLAGFEVVLSGELLQALALGRPLNAVEHVPLEVLSLKGPAFWLAWQVSFLRRWARRPRGGAQGKPLVKVLEEAGYLSKYSRGEKIRYKDALQEWWRDVGNLVDISLLDEPGVRLYRSGGPSWRDVSSQVSRALEGSGKRLTREFLEQIRVVFAVPRSRSLQLEKARRRSRPANRA